MGYVLGMDAGGTKSHLVLFDTDGRLAGTAVWGTLNHEMLPGSFTQLKEALGRFVAAGLSPLSLFAGDVDCAVFGVAGADTLEQHDIIGDIIAGIGFARYHLYNDAFLGIPAGSPDGAGISAINGTGATLAGIDHAGRRLQIGGIGDLSDDRAGAGYLGLRVLSAVYTSLFREGPRTLLADRVMAQLNVTDKAAYVEALTTQINDGRMDVARLNRLLFECGEQGDAVSLAMLEEMAENYAGAIRCMAREMAFRPDREIHVTLAGSVFVKEPSPLLRDMLSRRVCGAMPERAFSFTKLEIPPVGGAVLWGFKKLGLNHLRDKVAEQLRELRL